MRLESPRDLRCISTGEGQILFRSSAGASFGIQVLEEWLIRVWHRPDGAPRMERTWMVVGTDPDTRDTGREGRLRDDLSVFSRPAGQMERSGEHISLSTGLFSVQTPAETPCLTWSAPGRESFCSDLGSRAYQFDRAGDVYHYLKRRPDEFYYGFGERSGELDKKGRRMRMCNLDALGYNARTGDPLYKHWPIYITWHPETQTAYGLIYDNLASTVFDMGMEVDAYHGDYRYWHAEGGDAEYYMVFGPSLVEVVERISLLIGRIPMPPRWSLGYLGSGMSYADVPDAATRLNDFVQLCTGHRIPCGMFHLSSGYSMTNDGRRHVFSWNREKITDPPAIAGVFHRAGMRVTANIKPALLTTHPDYGEAEAGGVLLGSPENTEISAFWGGEASYIDFTSDQGYRWWQKQVREQILAMGIDATWNDNNEYEVWNDTLMCRGFGHPFPIGLGRPIQALLMVRSSWEAQKEFKPDERSFVLTRSGCPGIQRYAQTWSGDNSTSWETLKYNIPMGLGFGLTGHANFGHDIGGFWGEPPGPELLVRWVHNGIFHPRFSIHSWRLDGSATEPWMYPETTGIIRAAIEFRHHLMPYLYSLLAESSRTGHPVVRATIYEFPGDRRCADQSFEFMLGPWLFIPTVFESGARMRRAYLPQGTGWCDFHEGTWYQGGGEADLPAPLERPTLLARSGALVAAGDFEGERIVYAFPAPGGGMSDVIIIEDDGLNPDPGVRTEVHITMDASDRGVTVRAHAEDSGYALPYSSIRLALPPGDDRPVNGSVDPVSRDSLGRAIHIVKVKKWTS